MIDKMNDVVEYWFGTTEDGGTRRTPSLLV